MKSTLETLAADTWIPGCNPQRRRSLDGEIHGQWPVILWVNLEEGTLTAAEKKYQGNPMSEVARDTYLTGGLNQLASLTLYL